MTKVSIIIPYKTDRGYLQHAIDSVGSQTYKNIQLIIQQGDCGVSENLNKGIGKATGDLITYLCDDDLLPPNAIQDTVDYFRGDFIHGNAINFWNDGRKEVQIPAMINPTLKDLVRKNHIHGGTVTYHASVFENNLFDESLTTGEEYEFNMRLISQGKELKYINKLLYLYRRHEEQKSLGNRSHDYKAQRRIKLELIKKKYR